MRRLAIRALCVATVGSLMWAGPSAAAEPAKAAAEGAAEGAEAPPALVIDILKEAPLTFAGAARQIDSAPGLSPARPAALPALYGGFVALQLIDAATTAGALGRGAREANPLLRQQGAPSRWAVRTAATVGTVYFVEKLWKKNRLAAILVMAGLNGGYAAIALHNVGQR